MNAEFDAPKDVAPVQQAGDASGLSSAQSDSFKGFDNFSSIKSSMSDSTNTSLPELQLLDTDSQSADTNQNRPGENQNPGDSPQNPDPNRSQNPGGGERNDDPRSKNQPGSDASPKQPGALDDGQGVQADGGSKDQIDDRSKDTPPDNGQKQLEDSHSVNGKQQSSDADGPMQPPAEEGDGPNKPNPDDPGLSKQPPEARQKEAQSTGDQAAALNNAPSGGGSDGKAESESRTMEPAKPDVTPRPDYNF